MDGRRVIDHDFCMFWAKENARVAENGGWLIYAYLTSLVLDKCGYSGGFIG